MNLLSKFAITLLTASDGATPDPAAPASGGSIWTTVLMVVAMVALLYFMMIRPERKKKKTRETMMSTLSVGDSVTTIGGLVGKVVHITDSTVTFETSEDRVRIEVTKAAIQSSGKPTE
ncbi:MAG: preprotein translocase subunit YajC [Oscillospiraceae bacterium]|nr:preprotein translocase subunit YajC [Oscillospiraceae bacterium]